ncbi:MAG: helix-turn-helix domain-containing protein, partial [Bacteroidales bacterium]
TITEIFNSIDFTKNLKLNSMDEKFLRKAIKIVEEKMDDPEFSVEVLGQELGMSRTNLFRKLKALTNQSASHFIRTIKIKRASLYLDEGFNISEASIKVGINSRSYFKKCFEKQFKISPSEYIKQKNKNISSNI